MHIPGNGGRVSLSGGSSVVGGDRDTVTELWDPASAPSHPSTVVGGIVSSAYLPLNDGGGNRYEYYFFFVLKNRMTLYSSL